MNPKMFLKMPGLKKGLLDMVTTHVKPSLLAKKAEFLKQLEPGEKDIAFIIRSSTTELYYFITTIKDDGTNGRVLQQGKIDELLKF